MQARGVGCALTVGLLLASSAALAQPASDSNDAPPDAGVATDADAAAPAPAPSTPMDVVLLKGGGMLRGTIVELVPGEMVRIQLVDGQTREYPTSEVEYAGPHERMPSSTPKPSAVEKGGEKTSAGDEKDEDEDEVRPLVTVHGKETQLQLVGTQPGVTFYRRSGAATAGGGMRTATATGYDEICTTPCKVSMPAGTYTMALSLADGPVVEAKPVTFASGSYTLQGEYTRRRGGRVAGWVILGVGTAVGTTVILVGQASDSSMPTILGGGVMVVSTVVGLILGLRSDSAQIRVLPGPQTALLRPRSVGDELDRIAADRASRAAGLPGLGVALGF